MHGTPIHVFECAAIRIVSFLGGVEGPEDIQNGHYDKYCDENIPVPLAIIASQAGGLETPQREQYENASDRGMGDINVHR